MMVHFYTNSIMSILTCSIIIWYAAATVKDKSRLKRIIRSAEREFGFNLLSHQALHTARKLRQAGQIVDDSYQP